MGAKLLGQGVQGQGLSPPATQSVCSSAPHKARQACAQGASTSPMGLWSAGVAGKGVVMRALKIEWDWDLNGTLWETWKHFLIPINESRCINDDCIAS